MKSFFAAIDPVWWLLDAEAFVTRDQCGEWDTTMKWLSQIQDLGFGIAYTIIPVLLLYLLHKKRDILCRPWIVLGFAVLIFLCGLTHFGSFLTFYWPAYRLFVSIGTIGAAVSIFVALSVPEVVRHVMSLKSPIEYQAMIDQLSKEAEVREQVKQQVERELKQLKRDADEGDFREWMSSKHILLDSLLNKMKEAAL